MTRGLRLDGSGVLHYFIARALERGALFRDARGRADLLRRRATLAIENHTSL